jgi:glycosyltransferase involved in cell wall biosynthesis
MSRVLFIAHSLPQYRVPFFNALRDRLAVTGVDVAVAYGTPRGSEAAKGYQAELEWGTLLQNRSLSLGRRGLLWQPCLREAWQADLVVVEQASRLLANYILLAAQAVGSTRVAFWGHGANHNPHEAYAAAELVKRRISRLPHWWFAYTERSRQIVRHLGYPGDRITVVHNATEKPDLRYAAVHGATFRKQHTLGNGPIGLFMGSLYPEKRLAFLFQAADRIYARRSDFRLVLVGDGPDREAVLDCVAKRAYARYLGPRFGHDRVAPLAAARVVLMPGLVGLAVVDAFAARRPLITTAVDYHSPEIEYVRDGSNAVVVADASNVEAYADAVLAVLSDDAFYNRLTEGCRSASAVYTLDAMVERFARGIVCALSAPPPRSLGENMPNGARV